jgi:hypothetical protein
LQQSHQEVSLLEIILVSNLIGRRSDIKIILISEHISISLLTSILFVLLVGIFVDGFVAQFISFENITGA